MPRHCTSCGEPFEPRPQVPDQTFCSSPGCQRARKRQWQRAKLQSDPDYRINQRAAQQAWSQRNQDYWRNYRDARPEYAQRNHEQQRSRDQGRNGDFAKMDACHLPSGLYCITRHPALPRENSDSWVVEITPVCVTCPCKMDVSREDVIDASSIRPYLSCAVGRGVYLPIGNTWHHARLFCLHVGRSGRGRKGDAVSLVLRIDQALRAMDEGFAPHIHRGGLSSREGLVALMHDGYRQGRQEVPAIEDKRLWVVESEFANVLHQGRRDGNTLSAALRDCWDGVDLKPATKSNRLYASHPHVCLSGAISPSELTVLMSARELTNGFANRFLMIWAERTRMLPFPKETQQAVVEHLARRTLEVLAFVRANRHDQRDHLRMELSPQAQWRYAQLYRGELNDDLGDGAVGALLERRAPILLRLAMLMVLTDLQTRIEAQHIDAAMAWIRHATASVRFVFVSAAEEAKLAQELEFSNRVVAFLRERGQATRSQISAECFRGKVPKARIDASLELLLASTPPKILVQCIERPADAPGAPTRVYRLA